MLSSVGKRPLCSYKEKSDPERQARYADEQKLPFILWLGESELDQGQVHARSQRNTGPTCGHRSLPEEIRWRR